MARHSFGVRAAGKPEPIDADTVFQLASVSKPIATTVLAALVGEGVINWDDRLIDHLPDFRMSDPWVTREVTLRDMLCHRSGLPLYAGDLLEAIGYDRTEVLHRLRFEKPASSFRSQYAYTNFGFTAAAEAGARAAKKPWEELCAEKLYRPLGMKSTSSRYADYASANNRALLHVQVDGQWVVKHVREPDAQAPAGGVSSTARDLASWLRLQLAGGKWEGKQLVSARALMETHRPQIASDLQPKTNRVGFYGLGWELGAADKGRVYWKHPGEFSAGLRTEIVLLPAEELGIAVLANAAPSHLPEAMTIGFFNLVFNGKLEADGSNFWADHFNHVVGPVISRLEADFSQPPANALPALPLSAYVGTYANDYFGPIEIVEKEGTLILTLGPKKTAISLRHWDRDVFIRQPSGESAGKLNRAMFLIGPDRHAIQVVTENSDVQGQGVFVRVRAKK